MPDLFDWQQTTEQARDEAIARARDHAPTDWYERALQAVQALARRLYEFTTDEVWAEVKEHPPEPRALGAVMEEARRNGWITRTDRTRKSVRRDCHGRPVRLWQSRLFGVKP